MSKKIVFFPLDSFFYEIIFNPLWTVLLHLNKSNLM